MIRVHLIFLLLIGILFFFRVSTTTFTCNPNKKIRYGRTQTPENNCKKFGGCWENGYGCYFSQENIPGFRMMRGDSGVSAGFRQISNIERKQCSRECLKLSNCFCFTYDSLNKNCELKDSPCYYSDFLDNNKVTYNRYATSELSCFQGNCAGSDEFENSYDIRKCSEKCSTESACNYVKHFASGQSSSNVCAGRSTICDFTQDANKHIRISMCLPGPAFPDWLTNHLTNRVNIIDSSNETCKSVGLAESFNLRIPWPSVNHDPEFLISIVGKNLKSCINSTNGLQSDGIIAYVLDSWQSTISFNGYFKGCKLEEGNDSEYCKYSCSCDNDFCEAVHIRAFSSDENSMSICKYDIIHTS